MVYEIDRWLWTKAKSTWRCTVLLAILITMACVQIYVLVK